MNSLLPIKQSEFGMRRKIILLIMVIQQTGKTEHEFKCKGLIKV